MATATSPDVSERGGRCADRSMRTALTLVCHASTEATTDARFPADEPLDERGAALAAAAAGVFARVDEVWCGPARRCVETATAMGRSAVVEPALRECDFNRWRGRALADVQADEPGALTRWLTDPAAAPHGGESIADLLARVGKWLDARCSGPVRAAAVTHPSVIRAAIIHAIHARPESFWRIDVPPLSCTVLRGHEGSWTLRSTGGAP